MLVTVEGRRFENIEDKENLEKENLENVIDALSLKVTLFAFAGTIEKVCTPFTFTGVYHLNLKDLKGRL